MAQTFLLTLRCNGPSCAQVLAQVHFVSAASLLVVYRCRLCGKPSCYLAGSRGVEPLEPGPYLTKPGERASRTLVTLRCAHEACRQPVAGVWFTAPHGIVRIRNCAACGEDSEFVCAPSGITPAALVRGPK